MRANKNPTLTSSVMNTVELKGPAYQCGDEHRQASPIKSPHRLI